MSSALLLFHQGWTDILNCLGMISHNSKKYDTLYVVYRNDAKPLAEFYSKSYSNVKNLYLPFEICHMIPSLETYIGIFQLPQTIECIGIGQYSIFRNDKFKNTLFITEHFWLDFYRLFNMDPIIRLRNFEITRDNVLENIKYQKHVNKEWKNYRLYHDCDSAKIPRDYSMPLLELGKLTDNLFFDTIKILENAYEMYLIDSVWAMFTYLLDYKYGLFNTKNIKIKVFAKRGYNDMFLDPKLPNWEII
jgi:hypothetical protein